MRNKKIMAAAVLLMLALCVGACGRKTKENPYGPVIEKLGDEDAYAFLDMDYENYVMVTSDGLYNAGSPGTAESAAIDCKVYYYEDGEFLELGTIQSGGTAYPISFSRDGIFAGSNHRFEKYAISEEDQSLYVKKGVYVTYDENGNEHFTSITDGMETESNEEEFEKMAEEYGKSQVIHFSYGASGSVNEIEK